MQPTVISGQARPSRRKIFTAVPFGLNFQGMTAWIYHGGGLKLWEEMYEPFNLVPMRMGNTGVQMSGLFRKPIENVFFYPSIATWLPKAIGW
jgi:TRAP-type mannitol/chloroaromatic compound transport system substrate-binding protein